PEASNSTASVMRAEPPVRTTIPSALRSSETSASGTLLANQRNPAPRAKADSVRTTPSTKPARLIVFADDGGRFVCVRAVAGSGVVPASPTDIVLLFAGHIDDFGGPMAILIPHSTASRV